VVDDGNGKHLQLGEKEGEVRRGPIGDEGDRRVELTEGGDSRWWELRNLQMDVVFGGGEGVDTRSPGTKGKAMKSFGEREPWGRRRIDEGFGGRARRLLHQSREEENGA
jgi:hypothetical protein